MQVTIHGSTIELTPFGLINDMEKSANYNMFGCFTDWANSGNVIDLRFLYSDIQREYGGSDYTGPWEDMFEWEYTGGSAGPGPGVYRAQCRPVMSAANPMQITWQFRQCHTYTNPNWWSSMTIDYSGSSYENENQIFLCVIENINAELCVNEIDVPMFQPGDQYNGLLNIYLAKNTVTEELWESVEGTWTRDTAAYRSIYMEELIPANAHNLLVGARGYHLINGIIGSWYLPSYEGLSFEGTPPDELDPKKTPDNDNTGPDGGKGPYTDTSTRIGPAKLPTTSALSAGFVKAYQPSASALQALSSYMLTDSFIQGVKKLFANPIDYIMGLHMIPVAATTTSSTIKVGGVDTSISSSLITNEYVQFDCGTLNIEEFWGSFIDYSPATKAELYLPFIGTVPLDIDDIMGNPCTLHLYYNINVLSGSCTAFLDCQTGKKLNSVCYYWNGSMISEIPVTGNDYSNKVNAAFSAVGNLIGVAATGSVGNAVGLVQNMAQATLQKPTIQKSGVMGGDSGMLSEFQAFVILTRPVQALPKNYNSLKGNTSMIGGAVNSFSGFLQVDSVDLSGLTCTDAEKDEIEKMLKEGVFV